MKVTCASDDSGTNVRIDIYRRPVDGCDNLSHYGKNAGRTCVIRLECDGGALLASREEMNEYWGLAGKCEGKVPLRRSRHRWRIILKCILRKLDRRVGIGFIWLRIGMTGGLL